MAGPPVLGETLARQHSWPALDGDGQAQRDGRALPLRLRPPIRFGERAGAQDRPNALGRPSPGIRPRRSAPALHRPEGETAQEDEVGHRAARPRRPETHRRRARHLRHVRQGAGLPVDPHRAQRQGHRRPDARPLEPDGGEVDPPEPVLSRGAGVEPPHVREDPRGGVRRVGHPEEGGEDDAQPQGPLDRHRECPRGDRAAGPILEGARADGQAPKRRRPGPSDAAIPPVRARALQALWPQLLGLRAEEQRGRDPVLRRRRVPGAGHRRLQSDAHPGRGA